MKKLWAPWRLEYVRNPKARGCFLCAMLQAHDDRANLVLARGRTCAIVMNRYPYNNGHLIVCPYRHLDDVTLLTADERLETMDLTAHAVDTMRTSMFADGFNIGLNLGGAAGAGLDVHIHTHIVPRWKGDTNFMPILADVKIIPQSLLDLWDQLHPILAQKLTGVA